MNKLNGPPPSLSGLLPVQLHKVPNQHRLLDHQYLQRYPSWSAVRIHPFHQGQNLGAEALLVDSNDPPGYPDDLPIT